MSTSVILIDDERAMRESISQWLDLADCSVMAFSDSSEALGHIDSNFAGVVVTDLKMPGLDGVGVLQSVVATDPDIPVVLITGHGDVNSAVDAMRQGAYDFIEKPFEPERLLSTINRAREKRDLVMQNRHLIRKARHNRSIEERLIGECASIRQTREEIAQFASVDVNILLIGETGTGKEVVARCLHDFSDRKNKPFAAIDCGVIPSDRVEYDLFGEAGSNQSQGPFELARGGTVLLDEITNMPLEHQVKLLRVLEQREVKRVGSAQTHSLDIRLLTAANDSLTQALESDLFRQDLYFRLNTIEIKLPPLRQREDDCVLLFEHFTKQASQLYERELPTVTSRDITALRTHAWPGNVRELKNVAERFVLYQTQSVQTLLQAGSNPRMNSLNDQVQAFEKSIIEYALNHCDDSINKAADFLSVPRRTLNDKLQRHGIERNHQK